MTQPQVIGIMATKQIIKGLSIIFIMITSVILATMITADIAKAESSRSQSAPGHGTPGDSNNGQCLKVINDLLPKDQAKGYCGSFGYTQNGQN